MQPEVLLGRMRSFSIVVNPLFSRLEQLRLAAAINRLAAAFWQ
jgi:hypothetical protein